MIGSLNEKALFLLSKSIMEEHGFYNAKIRLSVQINFVKHHEVVPKKAWYL